MKSKTTNASSADNALKIQSDTEAFLAGGGKIQEIPSGISGTNAAKPDKHIRLGRADKPVATPAPATATAATATEQVAEAPKTGT